MCLKYYINLFLLISRLGYLSSNVQMHKNPINTPIMNASELIDGVEQYNAYDAGGKKNIYISMITTMIFNRTITRYLNSLKRKWIIRY